jgi:hypothetical protein
MTRDGRLLQHRGSARCEQLGGFHRAKAKFNGVGAGVAYLIRQERPNYLKDAPMKVTTIALAIAFALPSSFAIARGGMHVGSSVSRPFASAVGTGRIANRPRNATGNTLAPIARDPSGSTINGPAMNRNGG